MQKFIFTAALGLAVAFTANTNAVFAKGPKVSQGSGVSQVSTFNKTGGNSFVPQKTGPLSYTTHKNDLMSMSNKKTGSGSTFQKTFLSNGHRYTFSCYPSSYRGWSKYCWFPNHRCYGYYCPTESCWYYYSQSDDCYIPCSYLGTNAAGDLDDDD